MSLYTVEEVEFGTKNYKKTVLLRDKVMRKPLGLSIKNDDLTNEKQATILAVFDADTLLGTGIFTYKENETAKVCFLCVDTNLQKGGIGRMILEDIERRSLQHRIKKIYLESRVTAKDFYKNQGYREYGDIYLMKEAPVEHIWMEKML